MKKPTNNNIHGLILIMRDSSNDIALTDCPLGHGVWQIDSICQTKLVGQLARPLTTRYDVKFYESILFVKLY